MDAEVYQCNSGKWRVKLISGKITATLDESYPSEKSATKAAKKVVPSVTLEEVMLRNGLDPETGKPLAA